MSTFTACLRALTMGASMPGGGQFHARQGSPHIWACRPPNNGSASGSSAPDSIERGSRKDASGQPLPHAASFEKDTGIFKKKSIQVCCSGKARDSLQGRDMGTPGIAPCVSPAPSLSSAVRDGLPAPRQNTQSGQQPECLLSDAEVKVLGADHSGARAGKAGGDKVEDSQAAIIAADRTMAFLL